MIEIFRLCYVFMFKPCVDTHHVHKWYSDSSCDSSCNFLVCLPSLLSRKALFPAANEYRPRHGSLCSVSWSSLQGNTAEGHIFFQIQGYDRKM